MQNEKLSVGGVWIFCWKYTLFKFYYYPFAGNVSQDFSNLDTLDLDDTLELLESTQDSLDEIWKQEDHKPYSEMRMKHLLDVMAGALARYVQRKLGMLDIWRDSFQQVKDAMRKGITVCERWVSTCETLTSQYWKRFPSHPWRGEKFTPENLSQLAARLEEVLTVTYLYLGKLSPCLFVVRLYML